ncbi:hypothetical protein POMI540_4467 [Schizosaccharomyces pombe]
MKISVWSLLIVIGYHLWMSPVLAGPLNFGYLSWGQHSILEQDSVQLISHQSLLPAGDNLISLHKSLVEIESLGGNEVNVSDFLKSYLESKGLTVELQRVSSNPTVRDNVYAYLGSQRNTKVVLTSHIDTVNPFLPYYIEGDKIHGRGSCDAKSSVAAQIFAMLELMSEGKVQEGDLSLLFVVGEEIDGIGMKTVANKLNADWEVAIFGEPTENKLGVGHKGNFRFDVYAHGKACHSGYPQEGFSAIEFLLRQCVKLMDTDLPKSKLLGPSTINIGTIEGGAAANILAAEAKAEVFIRVAEDIETIRDIAEDLFDTEHSEIKVIQYSPPQYLDYDIPGMDTVVLAYATDIPYLSDRKMKIYLFGPGSIREAHGPNEYVTFSQLFEGLNGYKRMVMYNLR